MQQFGDSQCQARLADPPSPVSATSLTSGRSSSPATSSMACSRPTSEVVPTGSRREPGVDGAADAGERVANRSLSSAARSSRTSRPSSAGVLNLWYEASVRTRASSSARRGSRSGAAF